MPDPTSDQDLIRGCIAGEKRSWDLFVERFSKLVYWSARKTLTHSAFRGRDDLVQDVFQDVFQRLIENDQLQRLRSSESIRKYLSVMTCHAAMDKMRALARREKGIVLQLPEDGASVDGMLNLQDASPDPGLAADFKERERLVAGALANLSPKERLCVEWHFMDGRTHREISEVLGLSQDNVSTLIRRTREKLKKSLTEKGILD